MVRRAQLTGRVGVFVGIVCRDDSCERERVTSADDRHSMLAPPSRTRRNIIHTEASGASVAFKQQVWVPQYLVGYVEID